MNRNLSRPFKALGKSFGRGPVVSEHLSRQEGRDCGRSDIRVCFVTISGMNILLGFWLLNDVAQQEFPEHGAD